MRTPVLVSLLSLALALAAPAARAVEPVLYRNANIHTMNPSAPRAEAMLVVNGRIAAIGSLASVMHAAHSDLSPTRPDAPRTIDLAGKTILPGLVDCHGHMIGLGALHMGVVDLAGTRTYAEVIERVARRAKTTAPGTWIIGRGWDHESWPERALPTHDALSAATPDHPVLLNRVDGHALLANDAALRLAGITAESTSPVGGEIIRDRAGAPTGVLVDNAMALVADKVPRGVRPNPENALLKAQELCLSAGLTGVHDAGVGPDEIDVYKALEASGRLKIRVHTMTSAAHARAWFEKHGIKKADGDADRLAVRAAKLYIDGAMGSRGAWLLEPYADRSAAADGTPYAGLAVTQPAEVRAFADHALKHGYQLCTHAIGDRANREVLDAYERAMKAAGAVVGNQSPRFRIEHAQLLARADIQRFAESGIIASMQPTHATSDMRWVDARVGPERAKGAYAWASLLRAGAVIAGGSDFPVESHNPFLGLYAAITRQNTEGEPAGGWLPQERMTREEALRAFTTAAAYTGFAEALRGSLTAGLQADFIVIDRDVMVCPPAEIPATRVEMTVVGGEVVWSTPAPQ